MSYRIEHSTLHIEKGNILQDDIKRITRKISKITKIDLDLKDDDEGENTLFPYNNKISKKYKRIDYI
jgi:hypothetical protein